jgi:hypothetical protein
MMNSTLMVHDVVRVTMEKKTYHGESGDHSATEITILGGDGSTLNVCSFMRKETPDVNQE